MLPICFTYIECGRIELCREEKQVGQISDITSQSSFSLGTHSEETYLLPALATPQI